MSILKNDVPVIPVGPVGETLSTFFEMRNFAIPDYDNRNYNEKRHNNNYFNYDYKSDWWYKKAIVYPIIQKDTYSNDIILNDKLTKCMDKFNDTNRFTESGNLKRQGPIAFIVATSKGHSSLIVTCGDKVFGIGLIMSEETPVIVDPSFFDWCAKKIANIEPPKFEFTVDITSPDAAFDLFSNRRSSKGISYAACTIKAIQPFKEENVQKLLDFLNQKGAQDEQLWEKLYNTNSVEVRTNIKYQTVNKPFTEYLCMNPQTIVSMNCANFMELLFTQVTAAAYGGIASIPESITVNGKNATIESLLSLSQPESISSTRTTPTTTPNSSQSFSRSNSRSTSRDSRSTSRDSRSRSRDRDNNRDRRSRDRVNDRDRDNDRDRRSRDRGMGINKTKKIIEKKRIQTKEREKRKRRRTIRRRKPRRSTN
jgi:phage-related protein